MPIDLVLSLTSRRLSQYVPFFTDSHPISEFASEYSKLQPEFRGEIELATFMDGSVVVTVGLQKAGAIYGIILWGNKRVPSSRQIRHGLDGHNISLSPHRYRGQSVAYLERAQFVFEGLPLHAEMVVYLTAENDLPGNPDLMDDDATAALPVVVGASLDDSFKFRFQYYTSGVLVCVSLGILALV